MKASKVIAECHLAAKEIIDVCIGFE